MTDPPSTRCSSFCPTLCHYIWHVTCDMQHATCDTWHVTLTHRGWWTLSENYSFVVIMLSDVWYVTCDTWNVTLVKWHTGGGEDFFLFISAHSFIVFAVMIFMHRTTELTSKWINNLMTKVFVQQPWLNRILNNNGAGKTIRKEKEIKKSFKNF